MDKIILRKNVLKTRDELLREDQLFLSYEIMEKTVGHYEFMQAEEVLLYASYKSEVITDGIMEYAFMLGKKVYCPKVITNGVQSEMEFFQILSKEDLKEGYKGIKEPETIQDRKFIPFLKKAILIMPGAVFDKSGHRIGYGKGFYDRFLHGKEDSFQCKIALAYDFQVQEEIPYESHDVCADIIITEKDIIDCM